MTNNLTTKEIIVRVLLAAGIGTWMSDSDLLDKDTPWGFIGADASMKAHELARDGHYDSPTARYIIGYRKEGEHAQFRITERRHLNGEASHYGLINWFEELPSKRSHG